MQIALAFMFLTMAFFAEPIVHEMPSLGKDLRSVVDDFTAGDPKKIVHYKQATATIMEHGPDSAKIKYPISGYLMATGIHARNEQERSLLRNSPNGSGIVVYYDAVNPTIVVMQPTYNLAKRKMKGTRLPKGGYKKTKGHKKTFIPGAGLSNTVNYFRIGCIVIGFALLFTGAKALKA